ncbi:hypothetical protein FRC10_007387 [Ceratobasidium sp. 414]|nr:hypothetical protein FRC10_007387 [Ceratobasidium sp. 414]
MFKKSPHKLSTSSALRGSDVKTLRQRVVTLFPAAEPVVDELVPKGIMSCKFDTHLDEMGVLYLSADKEPLWFAMGRGGLPQSNLVPTATTRSVHVMETPHPFTNNINPGSAGADLMIPGVIPSSVIPTLSEGQLVAIAQYRSTTPLVVGSMALAGADLKDDTDQKGKAVITLHAMGDALWALGSKQEPPEGKVEAQVQDEEVVEIAEGVEKLEVGGVSDPGLPVDEAPVEQGRLPTPQEVEITLRATTLYALAKLDSSSLPMPASTLYSSHILPSRPARPVLPGSSTSAQSSRAASPGPDASEASTAPLALDPKVFLAHLDIKHTPQKKLAPFLKSIEKDGIIKLKDVRGELLVFSVDAEHPALVGARSWGWKTVGAEQQKGKEAENANANGLGPRKEMLVEEVWFPEAAVERFFEACGESERCYPPSALRPLLDGYIASQKLQHPANPKYVVLDDVLSQALRRKGEEQKEFVSKAELVDRLTGNMKGMWRIGGSGPFKKLPLPAIVIKTQARQGRKVVMLITGVESFGLDPGAIAEELKKRCASSTSVIRMVHLYKLGSAPTSLAGWFMPPLYFFSPCPEKPKNLQVMVQGGHVNQAALLLLELGVPTKWITVLEKSGKGKGGNYNYSLGGGRLVAVFSTDAPQEQTRTYTGSERNPTAAPHTSFSLPTGHNLEQFMIDRHDRVKPIDEIGKNGSVI